MIHYEVISLDRKMDNLKSELQEDLQKYMKEVGNEHVEINQKIGEVR